MFKSLVVATLSLVMVSRAFAQQGDVGPPVTPEQAKSKTGEFLVSFTEKSPDSEIATFVTLPRAARFP
jgi:hypothetical protein